MRPGKSACRSCRKPIIWCRTLAGKDIDIDVEPSPKGTLTVYPLPRPGLMVDGYPFPLGSGEWQVEVGDLNRKERLPGLYTSHFTTCRYAAWHRRQT